MAKFKDNATGNVFEYFTEHDIKTMRDHPEYTEVLEEVKQEVVKKPLTTKKQLKDIQ